MEYSLHRQLKEAYADQGAQLEATLGRYRIDVLCDDELIEIQHGSLAAIRDKVKELVADHRVLVVKPLVRRKRLIKQDARGGRVTDRRFSPKQGCLLDLFDELVYFTRVFPNPNLTVEVAMVDIEELRYPGHGRRRRWRENDHEVEDQRLLEIHTLHRFRTARDLLRVIPGKLPAPFHTGDLAQALDVSRSKAQQIAYCLRQTKAVEECGKKVNARLYKIPA